MEQIAYFFQLGVQNKTFWRKSSVFLGKMLFFLNQSGRVFFFLQFMFGVRYEVGERADNKDGLDTVGYQRLKVSLFRRGNYPSLPLSSQSTTKSKSLPLREAFFVSSERQCFRGVGVFWSERYLFFCIPIFVFFMNFEAKKILLV